MQTSKIFINGKSRAIRLPKKLSLMKILELEKMLIYFLKLEIKELKPFLIKIVKLNMTIEKTF